MIRKLVIFPNHRYIDNSVIPPEYISHFEIFRVISGQDTVPIYQGSVPADGYNDVIVSLVVKTEVENKFYIHQICRSKTRKEFKSKGFHISITIPGANELESNEPGATWA